MTTSAKRPPTNAAMAARLGAKLRTFERWRAAGIPLPRDGEALSRWRPRAARWIAAQAKARDQARQPDLDAQRWLLRFRVVRAQREAHRTAQLRSTLHAVADCCARAELRALLQQALAPTPDVLAQALPALATEHELAFAADTELRAALERIAWPEWSPAEAAEVELAEPPAEASVAQQSEHWLRERRRQVTLREESLLAVDRGELHDRADCERRTVQRASELLVELLGLPARWARQLMGIAADQVRTTVADDLARVIDGLERGFAQDHDAGDDAALEEPEPEDDEFPPDRLPIQEAARR